MRLTWVQPEDLVRHELLQSAAEGRDVTGPAAVWTAAGGSLVAPVGGVSAEPPAPHLTALARRLLAGLDEGMMPDPAAELATIRNAAGTPPELPSRPAAPELLDRLHGAWLGRAAGCLLGKPVEKIPREGIREILQSQQRWPLADYFTSEGLPDEVALRWPWNRASRTTSLAEVITGMPEDDDLNFTMLALLVMEGSGADFSSDDIARLWLSELPAGRVFTAERVAYRNLLDGLTAPETARVRNPFREWIGAQIRTDLYGWACPGDPLLASELAWRDARLSHTGNGVFGAMFTAAMGAAAVVSNQVETVIETGLSVIPVQCRLAAAVRLGIEAAREPSLELGLDRLHQAYGDLHWVHSVNNAALVAFGLTIGAGDFSAAICATVSGGWDTDSNGATVGGVLGAMRGAGRLPASWTEPLQNRVASSLRGFDGISFDQLASRVAAQVGG